MMVPAANEPTEPPTTAPTPTGQLGASQLPVSVGLPLVPAVVGEDCWLERIKEVRLKEKVPPLPPQHELALWSLQHQLGLDPP